MPSLVELLEAPIKKPQRSRRSRAQEDPDEGAGNFPKWEDMVKCPHCPGAYANVVMKFVGFRGHLEEHEHPKGGIVQLAVIDIKGEEHPGEVFPEPIVPVRDVNRANLIRLTGKTRAELGRRYFIGILKYEVEVMTLIFFLRNMGYENIMVLMPRGIGKTYIEDWENALGMKYFNENVLLLSESDAMLKVGNWIYTWAFKNGYLRDGTKNAKQSSYQHFVLKNGSQLDIYDFMNKKTVGMHDVKIVGDDIVNLDWKNRPNDLRRAKEHWSSNLNNMIRTGLEIFGTRKFEGDLLQHFMETIENLIIIKMSPFIKCEHDLLNPQGTYDPCPICRDLAILAPEIHSYDNYMVIMEEDYESWYAEQMQDPHSKMGGMVEEDDIEYCNRPFHAETDMCGIGVDVAEEWENSTTTDMSAVVACTMSHVVDEAKIEHKRFTFIKARVKRMPYRNTKDNKGKMHKGLIETIDKYVKYLEHNYPHKPIIIAIERNGPGIVLINMILREKWPWARRIIADKGQAVKWTKEGRANIKLGINHQKEKIARIFSELRHPIKEKQIQFAYNLEETTFILQVVSFPKGKHDDGPDGGGMIKDELNRRWKTRTKPKPRIPLDEKIRKERAEKNFNNMAQPWKVGQEKAQRDQKMRMNRTKRQF